MNHYGHLQNISIKLLSCVHYLVNYSLFKNLISPAWISFSSCNIYFKLRLPWKQSMKRHSDCAIGMRINATWHLLNATIISHYLDIPISIGQTLLQFLQKYQRKKRSKECQSITFLQYLVSFLLRVRQTSCTVSDL